MSSTEITPNQKTRTAASLQQPIDALIQSGTASSTRRAYQRDVPYITHWYQLSLNKKLRYPVTVEAVMQFVLDHTDTMPAAIEAASSRKVED